MKPSFLGCRLLVALLSGAFTCPGISAESDGNLSVILTADRNPNFWNQTDLITATVTWNGTPLQNAKVDFKSHRELEESRPGKTLDAYSGMTDAGGRASTNYTYNARNRHYYNDTVGATVFYQGHLVNASRISLI